MAHLIVHRFTSLVLLLAVTSAKDQGRWSRQISSYTSDISDWVPLTRPVQEPEPQPPQFKRQAVAEPRILTEPLPLRPMSFSPEAFPSRNYLNSPSNRQLYLQSVPSVPSAPQNFLTEQGFGQSIRFGLAQPNFPLNQGFLSAQFGYEGIPQLKPRPQPIQQSPIKFESFPKTTPTQLPLATQAKPFNQPRKPEAPKFMDGYRVENISNDFTFAKKKPMTFPKMKVENFDLVAKPQMHQGLPKVEREEVQLLYVPLESLNRGQFNFRSPLTSPQLVNTDLFNQRPKPAPEIRPIPKPLDNFPAQDYFPSFSAQLNNIDQIPKYSTVATPFPTLPPTTIKPKKLKPHQPPLAIFLNEEANKNNQIKVGDVLSSLKNANSIAVLDSVNPLNAPKVFIGPSSLKPPERYVKFELPYLSNIEQSDKKLRQLPFFVAPLSYNTPQGFAKIPFPSPHVGSVVINSLIKETPHPTTENVRPNYYVGGYTQEQKPVTQKPTISYYSTAATPQSKVPNYQSNYYSFEPQTVSTLRPLNDEFITPPKSGNYFLSNEAQVQYNLPNNFQQQQQQQQKVHESAKTYTQRKPEFSTTLRPIPTPTTTKPPSTYPSQLLETHNPYSINQAFHFSTPLDYHQYVEENKAPVATPNAEMNPPPPPTINTVTTTAPQISEITEKQNYYQQQQVTQQVSPQISEKQNYYRQQQVTQQVSPQISEKQNYYQQQQVTQQVSPQISEKQNYYQQQQVTQQPSPQISDKQNYYQQQQVPQQASPQIPEITEKQNYYQQQQVPQHVSPNYLQNYSPEIHYETEKQNPQYPIYNQYTTKAESAETYNPINNENEPTVSNVQDYSVIQETQEPVQNIQNENPTEEIKEPQTVYELENPNQYENTRYESYNSGESKTSTTSTTTTTRRTPIRTRGRPRYTTTPRIDSGEYTTRTATRRPLRERRPTPTRARYEPNRITSEKPTRRPADTSASAEISTKPTRTRNRGRVTFRPSENDEYYEKKTSTTKEQDLAYQRDVLHQNYPVTLMERMSTVDIEAITEPSPKTSPTRNTEPATETYDTENAYTNEKAAVSQFNYEQTNSKDDIQDFPARTTVAQEYSYISNSSPRDEEYTYSRNPVDSVPYTETTEREEDYAKQTTIQKVEEPVYATEPTVDINDSQGLSYTVNNEYSPKEETTTTSDIEVTKVSQEEDEENVVQTTPSYNRVRVRPGVIKQYHQASTESTRPKIDRRRPVTYRPAFDRRRTTMRIDEIEADLKTKQVHARPEVQDYKHPVYKPEPSTDAPASPEVTTKRGQFRRRRPTYSATSTEGSATRKNTYQVKNRFKGRRPTTEKPTDKPDTQTDGTTTTVRPLYSRYSHRPRLSERYNKKPEAEESEDQESNYSINRPKYLEPESSQWSPKINGGDSFKPYNPNDITDDQKIVTTERRSDKEMDIITARNDYDEEILLTVTPASNNRNNKKIPEIPPTLEALVEQSKVTKSDSGDTMSTFETMLEEVMKSLEEQDENEYSSNVMKHKGGEIGEIPPERIISSGDVYSKTTPLQQETTTVESTTTAETTVSNEEENEQKHQRRGFWKKVKVRPVTTESIEVAESQYYTSTVNRLGQQVKQTTNDIIAEEKPKVVATTYKPAFQFIKDIFGDDEEPEINTTAVEITKIQPEQTTTAEQEETTEKITSPGDLDLGTGSPDPTIDDIYITTEATTVKTENSHTYSFMDYLFGITSEDESKNDTNIDITTEKPKPTMVTTDVSFIPDEITTQEAKKVDESTELPKASPNPFDPANVVSTSMSTEVSHETEICFRGKCIKTSKDIL